MYVSLNLSLPASLMLLSRTGLMGRVAGSIEVSDVTHYYEARFLSDLTGHQTRTRDVCCFEIDYLRPCAD